MPNEVITVAACLRDGRGGSPTAVVTDHDGLDDNDLARIPAQTGTSHVAVIHPGDDSGGSRILRFFTAQGELPGCGHGTVAAIAVLTLRDDFHGFLRVTGRDFKATGHLEYETGRDDIVEAWFDQGIVEHRGASADERDAFLAALGLAPNALHRDDDVSVASPARERLMIPVADRTVLARIQPDQDRLATESRRYGQLGCFVYVPPSGTPMAAARMFAPAIGVPEDVANANSSGCLAAHLLVTGHNPTVAVDQGDALGRPSTVHATAARTGRGIATRVGGTARILPPTA